MSFMALSRTPRSLPPPPLHIDTAYLSMTAPTPPASADAPSRELTPSTSPQSIFAVFHPAILSPQTVIAVNGFGPLTGGEGTELVIYMDFHNPTTARLGLRVIVGRFRCPTIVRENKSSSLHGKWALHVAVPAIHPVADKPRTNEAVMVECFDNTTYEVLDYAVIGSFEYVHAPLPGQQSRFKRSRSDDEQDDGIVHPRPVRQCFKRESAEPPLADSPESDDFPSPKSESRSEEDSSSESDYKPVYPKRVKSSPRKGLQRATRILADSPIGRNGGGGVHPALVVEGDLKLAALEWGDDELDNNRRLVRFFCHHDSHDVTVEFDFIAQEDYRQTKGEYVASCIYRDTTDDCWITSVDVIGLLEFLCGSSFSVEEKNRIRRNLEGFKPKTIVKHTYKTARDPFFQLIMDFPDPKPRHIEKDLKVFKWDVLEPALDKIISKYSWSNRSAAPIRASPPTPKRPSRTESFESSTTCEVKIEVETTEPATPVFTLPTEQDTNIGSARRIPDDLTLCYPYDDKDSFTEMQHQALPPSTWSSRSSSLDGALGPIRRADSTSSAFSSSPESPVSPLDDVHYEAAALIEEPGSLHSHHTDMSFYLPDGGLGTISVMN